MKTPFVIFDRDGTLIEYVHYLVDPNLVKFKEDIIQSFISLQKNGFKFGVITNQSVIGRGLADYQTVNKINNKLSLIIKNLDSKLETLKNECANANEKDNDYKKNVLLLEHSSLIYNKGLSANNLLDYFTAKSNFKTDYYKFLFFFNIYKRELRVEEYLIYIILYFYSNPVNIDFSTLNSN